MQALRATRIEVRNGNRWQGAATGAPQAGVIMSQHGLDAPELNYWAGKFQHWFTPRGWREVGRYVSRYLSRSGYEYRIRRERMSLEETVWNDNLQVVIPWR